MTRSDVQPFLVAGSHRPEADMTVVGSHCLVVDRQVAVDIRTLVLVDMQAAVDILQDNLHHAEEQVLQGTLVQVAGDIQRWPLEQIRLQNLRLTYYDRAYDKHFRQQPHQTLRRLTEKLHPGMQELVGILDYSAHTPAEAH